MPQLARALYRTRQVAHALNPRLDEAGLEWAKSMLTVDESHLFFSMHRRDQRHALEVAGRLLAHDIDDPDLLKAALLHDCGKGEVPVWLRIAKVIHPGFVRTAGSESATGWRAAAYRLTHHAEIGATMVRDAGASELVAAFIRGHALDGHEERLALLMAADDAS